MSQSGRPHDAIGVIDLPLELELRLWEMRSVLNNRLLAAFWNHLLFRLWGIDGNGGGFRPAGELVKRDILPKVRERREDVRYYIPRAQFPLALLELSTVDARLRSIFVIDMALFEQASRSLARSESTERWKAKSAGSDAACLVVLRADACSCA